MDPTTPTCEWIRGLPRDYRAAEPALARLEHFHLGGRGLLEQAFAAIEPPPGDCLELACGVGGVGRFLLSRFAQVRSVQGGDIDPRTLAIANALNRHFELPYPVGLSDARELRSVSADWVLVSHLLPFVGLEFLPQLARAAAKKPVLLIEPVRLGCFAYPQIWADDASVDRLVEPSALRARLHQAGFRVQHMVDLGHALAAPVFYHALAGVPSLAEVAGLTDFARRARNGRDAVAAGQLSVVAVLACAD
ncbi:hypothetical protein GH975_03145 [Litorivicinus lipolyticus]|uniref:Methyltransferase domain-containing protein n=1 Tax=Litorivicinus lipolyticus TaxID=418701 RepID=A0A5Q2QCA3_9GAMM|nr:class I SAM-dependent methyltransferase [Litorivicinus lipolyticus]QGG79617.1 hypothetical protein GH975_03145 [Litorivicinus lipolyticus]